MFIVAYALIMLVVAVVAPITFVTLEDTGRHAFARNFAINARVMWRR